MKSKSIVIGLAALMGCASTSKKLAPQVSKVAAWDAQASRTLTLKGVQSGDVVKKAGLDCQVKLSGVGNEGSKIFWALNDLPPEQLLSGDGQWTIKDGFRVGSNVLRVFVLGPQGQLASSAGANVQVGFSYDSPAAQGPSVYIVSPRGAFSKSDGETLLFQVLVHNEAAKASRVFVRYSMNAEERELTGTGPFEFKNLPQGNYKVEAWLVNSAGRRADIFGGKAQANFTIQR